LPDDSAASGGPRQAINPRTLTNEASAPAAPPAPCLTITPDFNVSAPSSAALIDYNRLSPTSASTQQQNVARGRHRAPSPVRPQRASSHSVSRTVPSAGLAALALASERHASNHGIPDSRSPVTGLDPRLIEQQVQNEVLKVLQPLLKNFIGGKNRATKKAAIEKLNQIRPLALSSPDDDVETRLLKELYKMNRASGSGTVPDVNVGEDDVNVEWIYCSYEDCKKKVKRQCEMK
jgi:hypothetical protein